MLEKKKRSNKKILMLVLSLSIVMANGIVAFAKTMSGTTFGISYTYTGNVDENGKGSYYKATGSTRASIDTSKTGNANNYVKVHVDQEYTNIRGVKAVDEVKEYKAIKKTYIETPEAVLVPKKLNGKPVTARVGHFFSSNGISSGGHSVY